MGDRSAACKERIPLPRMVIYMTYNCCFCGNPIEEKPYTLTVSKEGCETSQELYCHEACLEKALSDPKLLYLKYL